MAATAQGIWGDMLVPRTRLAACAAVMTTLLLSSLGRADIFELTNGSRITGTWINADEKPVKRYVIQLEEGAQIVLTPTQVHTVRREPSALASYRRALAKMPDTAEAHWEMAQRCEKAKLSDQQEYHLRRAVELDPDHEGARRALGFVRIRGEWVMPDEYFQRLGYVRHKGKWRLPQEVELDARKQQERQERAQWRTKVRRWRTAILRGKPEDRQAAIAGFRRIDSPLAVDAIAKLLGDPKEPRQLKELYIESLGNLLPAPAAASALADTVLNDADMTLVEKAVAQLKRHDGRQFSHLFVPHLKSPDNPVINRAAYALGELGDPSVIPALIDALITEHRKQVVGSGLTVGRGSGGSGLTAGRGSAIVKYSLKNKSVQSALSQLTGGVNHGYDKTAWRRWYASTRLPAHYDVRRDE